MNFFPPLNFPLICQLKFFFLLICQISAFVLPPPPLDHILLGLLGALLPLLPRPLLLPPQAGANGRGVRIIQAGQQREQALPEIRLSLAKQVIDIDAKKKTFL